MKIALASDHAGYSEKERLKPSAARIWGWKLTTWARYRKPQSITLTTLAKLLTQVAQGRADQGVLVCGSGNRNGDHGQQSCRCACSGGLVGRDGAPGAST